MTKTQKLLADLVSLPSVNPAFLPPRHPHSGEGRVAEFIASIAARAGLDVELTPVLDHRPNVMARLASKHKARRSILLAPHLDTVAAMDDSHFKPRRRQDRLYGRGACDTKGSAAAMLTALCDLAASRSRPQHTEIVFAGLIDEENEQRGSRHLANSGFQADLAIIGEPTRLSVVTAHKGDLWLRFETCGRAAHGASPHLGSNAIHAMSRVVDALQTDYAAALKSRVHPLLGCPTVNVGAIQGGAQPNIVPDRCSILVDRRTLPGESEAGVLRELADFLSAGAISAGVFSLKQARCPPLETDPNLPLIKQFLRAARQARPQGVNYFCDAAVFAEAGVPSVVFGPGDIAQAHTADEWISLDSLERARRLLLAFLNSLP